MHKKINCLYKLAFLGLVTFACFENSVQAQTTCTPVVYAFRHAEDFNPPNKDDQGLAPAGGPYGFLIRAGAAHADLYPKMIKDLEDFKKYCPLTRVYAASSTNDTDGNINYNGAVNSFCTARPLAKTLSPPQSWTLPTNNAKSSGNPLCVNAATGVVEGKLTSSDPIMFIDKVGLDQALSANGSGPKLFAALLETAQKKESSAVFWTSEGLRNLGNAIINNGSQGPNLSKVPIKANGAPGRNAVYIFTLKADATGFDDTSTNYFQCFNFTNSSSGRIAGVRTNNWCGKTNTGGATLGSSTPGKGVCNMNELKANGNDCLNQVPIANLPGGSGTQINGKICNIKSGNTPAVTLDSSDSYFGYCTP